MLPPTTRLADVSADVFAKEIQDHSRPAEEATEEVHMTQPKPGTHDDRLQQLYTKRKQLDTQIKQTAIRRQRQQRQQALERVLVYGRLVRLAGLADTPPETLLGLLQDGQTQMADAATCQQWQTVGTEILARDKRLQQTVRRVWPHPTSTGAQTPGVETLPGAGGAGLHIDPGGGGPKGAHRHSEQAQEAGYPWQRGCQEHGASCEGALGRMARTREAASAPP